VIAAGLRPRVVSRRSLRRQYGRRLRRTFMVGLIMARRRLVRAYAPGMATESSVPPGALAFSRGLYASALDWYKVADSKGQVLPTLTGVCITVLSSLTIASSQNLAKLHTSLRPATWFLLAGAAVATAISILMAIACLYSRLPMPDSMRSGTPSLNEIHRETFAIGQPRCTGSALSPCEP
jgi:hypothetical protein